MKVTREPATGEYDLPQPRGSKHSPRKKTRRMTWEPRRSETGGWKLSPLPQNVIADRIPHDCRLCTWRPLQYKPGGKWVLKFRHPMCRGNHA